MSKSFLYPAKRPGPASLILGNFANIPGAELCRAGNKYNLLRGGEHQWWNQPIFKPFQTYFSHMRTPL